MYVYVCMCVYESLCGSGYHFNHCHRSHLFARARRGLRSPSQIYALDATQRHQASNILDCARTSFDKNVRFSLFSLNKLHEYCFTLFSRSLARLYAEPPAAPPGERASLETQRQNYRKTELNWQTKSNIAQALFLLFVAWRIILIQWCTIIMIMTSEP